jgi:hypothetical protein
MKDAIHSAISATLAGIVTDVLFYGVDSYKVGLQANQKIALLTMYRGVLPIVLTGI